MFDIIVIGAGLAGTLSALKFPAHYKVLLIEAGSEVLPISSSSYNECYKLHTGMHYAGDMSTAEHCLRKSIEFARELPDFIAGGNDLFAPWRRGRHYFMSNSFVSVDKAKELALHLQNIYRESIEIDARNKVFGEPEHFVRFLTNQDYQHIAEEIPFYGADGNKSMISVALGIETAESQIDISHLKAHLQKKINQSPNITFLPSTRVTSVAHNSAEFGYILSTKKENGEMEAYTATSIVNCAWQNIETLDTQLGLYVPDEHRVNRIKVSILISLPEQLRHMNTGIFSSGPYCSMTILPNGTAILTSERTTNIGYIKAGSDNYQKDMQDLLNVQLKLDNPRGLSIAESILNECASYLKPELGHALIHAPINALHVGFVKLIGNLEQYTDGSIYEADSVIHARQRDGVEVRDLGYIANSGMKMTFTVGNAALVADELEQHFIIIEKLRHLVSLLLELILPLPEPIRHQENNLTVLLYVTFRERLKEIAVSDAFIHNPIRCVQELKNEVISMLEKKHHVNTTLLSTFSLFSKNSIANREDALTQNPSQYPSSKK